MSRYTEVFQQSRTDPAACWAEAARAVDWITPGRAGPRRVHGPRRAPGWLSAGPGPVLPLSRFAAAVMRVMRVYPVARLLVRGDDDHRALRVMRNLGADRAER
jgi:hypothetical protein